MVFSPSVNTTEFGSPGSDVLVMNEESLPEEHSANELWLVPKREKIASMHNEIERRVLK